MELSFAESTRPVAQGILAVGEYYAFSNREIAHAIKDGDPATIRIAAKAMSQLLPKSDHRLLIPVPSHVGKATYTLRLAEAIAKAGCGMVYNVLKCTERETLYSLKQKGIRSTPESLGFYLQSPVPADWEIVFIDNVVATGTTAAACHALIGRGEMLVWAMDSTAYNSPAQQPKRVDPSFSQTSFDEWQAIERDILSGRGAYLCQQNERYYAHERQLEKSLQQFAAIRASIYQ